MNRKLLIEGLLVFALLVGVLVIIQFSTPNLVDNDGYYHIKMAYLMRTEGIKPPFSWLPLTILNSSEFADHHFLYHVLLVPFTFGDLRVGAKWAAVFFPALAFMAVWWLLKNQRVPFAALWTIGLVAISEAFIYRMSMPRAQSLSLVVLVLALHWMFTGKYRNLIWLSFLYVWLYDAFPLILILAGLFTFSAWLSEGHIEWKPLVYTGIGIMAGLLINPYFPANLVFISRHLTPKMTNPTGTSVGNEWFPYDTTQLMENSGLTLILFLSGVLALGLSGKRMTKQITTSLLVAITFGAMLFQSRRFIEYFPPFALIFAALAWSPIMEAWLAGEGAPSGLNSTLARLSHRLTGGGGEHKARYRLLTFLFLVVLMPALWLGIKDSRNSLVDNTKPYQLFAGASQWLLIHTQPGERIFHTDWDDFPRLFFYNTRDTYTIGLDPTYMQLYDADLYDLWVEVSQGDVDQPSQTILDSFDSRYLVTDLHHGNFTDEARADPNMEEVYRDEYSIVFHIVPETSADNN